MRACIVAGALVVLGCAQMLADVAGWPRVAALANATQVSPAMKVFTSHEGYETFSPRFSIRYTQLDGETAERPLTPETYAGLEGPYNRRNAYGAALAYAPVLVTRRETAGLVEAVMRYGFCEPAPLLTELGLDKLDRARPFTVEIRPRRRVEPARQLSFEVSCDEDRR